MNTLENLHIEATRQMPEVDFRTDGRLSITGRAIPDNAIPFFQTLRDWLTLLDCKDIFFDVNIEYINTSATMQLFALLQLLEEKKEIENIVIDWHYEEDDEDHYDTGLYFEERLDRTKFRYTVEAA